MYHTINVIWFYSYKLINIYQNIACRKNEMTIASDKFNAILGNTTETCHGKTRTS